MKYVYIVPVLVLSFFLIGCTDKKKDKISRLVKEWQGKEIIFPDGMVFTRYFVDTVDVQIPKNDYKILIYVDSLGCASCKLQLLKWKELISQVDSLTNNRVPFLFFLHPKEYDEMLYIFKRDRFDFPVCIDKEDIFNKQNKFPSNTAFQTFLLDKDNKVVVIGNPVHNLAVKDLYLQQLTQNSRPASEPIRTTAEATPPEINLGEMKVNETKTADFVVYNKGNNPLVIVETSTTCGCAVTTFDKHPANPGQSLRVSVAMSPKDSGMFDETIMVKCNTDQPIRLKIRGQAF